MTPTQNQDDLATLPDEERSPLAAAGERLRETASAARTRASEAYSTARDRTSQGIDSNPVAALVGGLAIGAILAAVLPRTKREAEVLGDWGKRLTDGARDAARQAKKAGVDKLDEFGVGAAKDKLKELATGKSGS